MEIKEFNRTVCRNLAEELTTVLEPLAKSMA